jgi:hypothetical protein
MKIAFDIGGVLSKYSKLRDLYVQLSQSDIEVYVISDIHPIKKIVEILKLNDLPITNVYSADYSKYGERCKQILCDALEIDILIDDFVGYLSTGKHIRFLVMPDPDKPYFSDDWKTDGSEGNFGRRCI